MPKKKYESDYSKVTEIIDKKTGEVISSSISSVKKTMDIDNGYVFFFYNTIEVFCNLWTTDQKIYLRLCFEYGYVNSFSITASFREHLCKYIKIGQSSFKKSISRLVEANLLLREEKRGEFKINPLYSWMGGLKEREKQLVKNIKNN